VVSESEVNGPLYRRFYFLKIGRNGSGLANIAGDENRFGVAAAQSAKEKASSPVIEKIQMDIINPYCLRSTPSLAWIATE
jgi:hypothetical protein